MIDEDYEHLITEEIYNKLKNKEIYIIASEFFFERF